MKAVTDKTRANTERIVGIPTARAAAASAVTWRPPAFAELAELPAVEDYPSYRADTEDDRTPESSNADGAGAAPANPSLESSAATAEEEEAEEIGEDLLLRSRRIVAEGPEAAAKLVRAMVGNIESVGEDLWEGSGGPHKLGTLFVAFGQELSGEVMRFLSDEEIRVVTGVVSGQGTVSSEAQCTLLSVFAQHLTAGEEGTQGGPDFARGALERAVGPEKAQAILGETARTGPTGFSIFKDVPARQVAPFLSNEHPQTIALILSQLDAEQSGPILAHLSTRRQADVSYRAATMEKVTPAVVRLVGEAIDASLQGILGGDEDVGGPKAVAGMLNMAGRSVSRNVMDQVSAQDPEVASALRSFTVEEARDRVRQAVLSMERPHDLHSVLSRVAEELRELSVSFDNLCLCIAPVGEDALQVVRFAENGSHLRPHDLSVHEVQKPGNFERWLSGTARRFQMPAEEWGLWAEVTGREGNDLAASTSVWVLEVPFEAGAIALLRGWEGEAPEFTEADAGRVQDFVEVVDLGYARYCDFREAAEAQSRLIAELEQTNADLVEARDAAELASQAKSQFLANISHEIRTPMNAIIGYAQILQSTGELSERHRKAVATIQSSGDHLLRLINEVLDISKIEAGHMELHEEDFELAQLLDGLSVMFDLRCREAGLEWLLSSAVPNQQIVRGDESKLMQVLTNLLGNSVKFTPEGKVSLRVTPEGDDRYRFEVEDTGPGIGAEETQTVFEPFRQGDAGHERGGTGLGLAVSKRLVELMGGDLGLTSQPGEGARLSFTVELARPRERQRRRETVEWTRVTRIDPTRTVRALVADDVLENREILDELLSAAGVEVILADNGEDAVELARRERPDIVFMDIRMPRMDGMEAMALLLDDPGREAVKVVAVSASTLEHERQRYLGAGFEEFIGKPVRVDEVYACMADLLGVEFQLADDGGDSTPDDIDASTVAVPADLRRRLQEAAEVANVTELRPALAELAELGHGHARLVRQLQRCIEDVDIEGVQTLLDQVKDA